MMIFKIIKHLIYNSILRTILLLFACSEAELRLTVITVLNDLLQNAPPVLPRNIGQIGQFEQYLLLSFYQGTR